MVLSYRSALSSEKTLLAEALVKISCAESLSRHTFIHVPFKALSIIGGMSGYVVVSPLHEAISYVFLAGPFARNRRRVC